MKPISLLAVASPVLLLAACIPNSPPPAAYPSIKASIRILPDQPNANRSPYCAILNITGNNYPAGTQVQLAAVGELPISFAQSLPPTTANAGNNISASIPAVISPNPSPVGGVAEGCGLIAATQSSLTFAIVAFDPKLGYGASTTVVVNNACPNFAPSQATIAQYCHPL
jgi:hypothetical protein